MIVIDCDLASYLALKLSHKQMFKVTDPEVLSFNTADLNEFYSRLTIGSADFLLAYRLG